MRRIFFRADANAHIGGGHMMRCLTIAEALGAADIVFVCADEESARLPRQAGFETRVLGTDYRDMEAEVAALVSMCLEPPASMDDVPDTIIVDSYHATDVYLCALREHARVVLIEDALTHARPADVIINYNLHASGCAYQDAYPSGARDAESGTAVRPPLLLIGPRYAPVRAQFTGRQAVIRDEVRDILILCGASDPLNAATQIYHALSERNVRFHIVCGAYNPHMDTLRELAKQDDRLILHEQVEDMAALMCDCDLAVTAAGSTIYELCAVGLPFVAFSLADNQDPILSVLEAEDIASCAGLFYRDAAGTLQNISRHVTELSSDVSLRKKRSEAQRLLVDGQGAARIVEALL